MLNTYPNANVQDFEPNRSYLEDRFKKNILQVQDVRTPIEEHPKKVIFETKFQVPRVTTVKTRSLIVRDIKSRGLQGCNVTLMDQEEIYQISGMLIEE